MSLAMTKARVLLVLICAGLLFARGPQADAAAPERPNILFFFVDDQRNDTLGCAGHPIIQTPTVDRLAAQGVRLENMFVTTSVCWVSRACVLTGMTARAPSNPVDRPEVLPEVRANRGIPVVPGSYETCETASGGAVRRSSRRA